MADIPCVGAVIFDRLGRLLLIKRAHAPAEGLWSIPGGRVEPGETLAQAVAREVLEETGLVVDVGREVGVVTRELVNGDRYVIHDFLADVGDVAPLRAGDDASDARFVAAPFAGLQLTPGLIEALTEWDVL